MNNTIIEAEQSFYMAIAVLLECPEHNYQPYPYSYRTRWNNHQTGNGRYPGHGIVRRFSSTDIHVQLSHPSVRGRFSSAEAALEAIRNGLKTAPAESLAP
jgi:hypothetical protein